jgi:hypothetical protein
MPERRCQANHNTALQDIIKCHPDLLEFHPNQTYIIKNSPRLNMFGD